MNGFELNKQMANGLHVFMVVAILASSCFTFAATDSNRGASTSTSSLGFGNMSGARK